MVDHGRQWDDADSIHAVENKKVGGTTADLMEDDMLGQYYFDYSRTKIITRIKVTADANLAKKHYENHQWEDQSKHASQFISNNFYDIEANFANPYDLFVQKSRPTGLTFGSLKGHSNISSSTRTNVWHSCAGPAVHNLNHKILKDGDLFVDAKVDFVHCRHADGIDGSGRPYVLVAFPYFTMTIEINYVEF